VICAPKLGGDENIFSLHTSRESLFKTFTNFVFVSIAVRTVNMLITGFECV
jgi:hypothetical protein